MLLRLKQWTLILLMMVMLASTAYPVNSQESHYEKHVLFISSYSASFPSIPEQIAGIQDVFHAQNILFDIEFMDTKRLNVDQVFDDFYDSLAYKLDNLPRYDLILVGDDNGLQFVMDHRGDLFMDQPVVFFAINDLERAQLAGEDPLMTGVVEELSFKETIDIAMNLSEEATQVMAITDNTPTGQTGKERFLDLADLYTDYEFSIMNSGNYSYDQLGDMIAALDQSTILVYLAMFHDKNGERNTIYESARMLEEVSDLPVYVPYSNGVGQGFFGGKVVYHFEQGRLAAQMAVEILEGTPVQAIPLVIESPNQYLFDYDQVKYFDMNEEDFPASTVFINKELTFYESYQGLILSLTLVILGLLIGIFILLLNIRKRVKAENDLTNANGELTALSEELVAQDEELRSQYNDLQESEHKLKANKERYRHVFEASSEGLWDYDYVNKLTYTSGGWHDTYIDGSTIEEWRAMILQEDQAAYRVAMNKILDGSTPIFSCDYRIIDKNGRLRWILEKGIVTYSEDGQVLRAVGSHVDITDKKEREEKIRELAYVDALTRLPNRTSLYEDFSADVKIDEDVLGFGALLFVDLDNFKYINDAYGHGMGDQVLVKVGSRLRELIASNVVAYRLGGDEFVIIFTQSVTNDTIEDFAIRLQNVLAKPIMIDESIFHLTSSIGIALIPENGSDINVLLRNADTAMYRAKDSGKDKFMYYNPAMNQEIQERMLIQNNIREAMDKGEFQLYYQPILALKSREIIGYEGLIRWFSEAHGYIPPDKFINAAEQMGIIIPLGNWVFETACTFSKKVNRLSDRPIVVTINVSPVQLIQRDFLKDIMSIVERTGVNPQGIGIEITETALMESFDDNRVKLEILQKAGITIYLDDFGTGYSSLNYLRELPFDVLKIDKSFIDDITFVGDAYNMTEDIIRIAHKVGVDVVAEGVEEVKQVDHLMDFQCDRAQGYVFSKPVNEVEALAMINKKDWQ